MAKDRTSSVAAADFDGAPFDGAPFDGAPFDGASTMDLSGRCVGSSYILQHPIGQGATGTVWRGLDRASGEPVAVKLLHESLLRQPKLVTRFVQERTILLMLRHRNVVRVRDLFSVGQTLGLVMDLVDGGSLRDHLREHGTMPSGEAARLAAQVAAALAEAHGLGVVHRDLKPDNILLRTENGRLDTRLTDFGVARILNTPSLTTPSAVVGTPHYMAPEAFHGATANPATDVYALGVLVYELITGRPPYESDSIPDLMRRHMDGNPARRPGIPDDLWDLIMSCTELKPRLRPSAAEMVAGLSDAARRFVDRPALPRPEHPVGPSEIDADLDLALPGRTGRGRADEPFWVDEVSQWDVALAAQRIREAAPGEPPTPPASGQRYAVDLAGGGLSADRSKVAGAPAGTGPGEAETPARNPAVSRSAATPAVPRQRGGPARKRRWAPQGVTVAVIAGTMLASTIATTAWNLGRAGTEPSDRARPAVLAAPTGTRPTSRSAAGATNPDPATPARVAARSPAARVVATSPSAPAAATSPSGRQAGMGAVRRGTATRVPQGGPAPRGTGSRSPQPEATPYGPWQCTPGFVYDMTSRTPLSTKPCHTLGRDIQYQASLTAPGGATGSISITLQDVTSGRTVAGPKTCDGLVFGGDAATESCGPEAAGPVRGNRYAVVMSYRYERDGQTVAGMSKGSAFTW